MESDDDQGGTTSIKWKDSAGDWGEKKAADYKKSDEDQGAWHKIRDGTASTILQDSAGDLGEKNMVVWMDLSYADSLINVVDYVVTNLDETKKVSEHVACKEASNTNVAGRTNGP